MPFSIVLMVLLAALCHALWNAILKSQPNQFSGLFAQLATVSVIAGIYAYISGPPPREVWLWLAIGQVLHFAYHCFLITSYRHGDISLVYPILRGAAPPMAAFIGFALLDETPSATTIIGIVIVSAGIVAIAGVAGGTRKAILSALATAVAIAAYSVIDAKGARLSGDVIQYVSWLLLMDAVFFMPLIFFTNRGRQLTLLTSRNWLLGAVGGLLSIAAYGLVLNAYTVAQVGAVSALRETSVIFGALIGMFFLGEKKHAMKFIGTTIIVSGVALIVI
ncbi:MAG: EamA family transporter [Gammaproteobacteria bacterium WSBS_2016_MAG_OTU1]